MTTCTQCGKKNLVQPSTYQGQPFCFSCMFAKIGPAGMLAAQPYVAPAPAPVMVPMTILAQSADRGTELELMPHPMRGHVNLSIRKRGFTIGIALDHKQIEVICDALRSAMIAGLLEDE